MRFLISLLFIGLTLFAEQTNNSDSISSGVDSALFDSSFFSGVLEQSGTDDAMGTQRLIDLRGSSFSPNISFSTNYNYTSNPLKAASSSPSYLSDGFTSTLNLMFSLGLGEIGIGDEVLLTPSFSFAQMRTYTDPVRDHGNDMKAFDVDVQIASFAMPFVLPNDFTLSIGHAYTRPISFRTKNIISYSNTPSVMLTKNYGLDNGHIFNVTVGASYSFTNGDTLEQQLISSMGANEGQTYYNFIKAVMENSGLNPSSQQPTTVQDAWTHMLTASYMLPVSEKMMITPSFNFSKMTFTEGQNTGREDYLTGLGLNFSYNLYEWLNFSALSNYTWKKTDATGESIGVPEYRDYIGGVAFGINYAF